MTPAVAVADSNRIPYRLHAYEHDPKCTTYGEEAAAKLCVETHRVFKTLVISLGRNTLAVAVIPVDRKLSLKRMAKAAGTKKADMADKADAERATGYVLGGVSPLGQKKRLATFVDRSARDFWTIFVSAGRRGLEIELSPVDLERLTDATVDDICLL